MKRSAVAGALALVVLGIAACGGESGVEYQLTSASPKAAEPTVPCAYDYEPASGPGEIASWSEILVRGTIARPRAGLFAVREDGSPGRVQTDVFPIKVKSLRALGGEVPPKQLDRFRKVSVIYVETGCAFAAPARQAKLAAFRGRRVLAYLVRADPGGKPGRTSYGTGGPPRPLFRQASLEGFLIELASGKGVRDLELNQRYPGAGLDQFLPAEDGFPPRG